MDPHAELRDEVEQFIIERLAEEKRCDPVQLREDLSALGAHMPYDSIQLVEVMTKVEARFGVRLRTDLPTARDMRSVRSFAERVCDELDATASQPAATTPAAPPAGDAPGGDHHA
ncbi:acyl carrier protein [Amycolatopsis sp. 195334CR]|uniref:acyl carrier protein n=1 Tax=Amycolatopsis sp. 195334CR TaxID=2814588 RepID=UPI001A8D36F2|nr:acyl carrier protein [Amycolatopsis sp. 195334CR]MBN6040069.1 acyl carrier protein [Amycolatopsis sp. 195334CR]